MLARSVRSALFLALSLGLGGSPAQAEAPDDDSPHVWNWAFRGATWLSTVTGKMDVVDASDLELDDWEFGALGEAEWRSGRHNVLASFSYYRNEGSDTDLDRKWESSSASEQSLGPTGAHLS